MITPISLESDIEVVSRQLEMVREVGAKRFHIDIIDGYFADNITVSPADLQVLKWDDVKVDLHLLVDDPVEWLEECVALKPARIIAQIEKMGNIENYIGTLKGYDNSIGVGLGVGVHTPVTSLSDKVLENVDAVLLMAIEAGFGGTPFKEVVLTKISELRARWDGWIIVDGGIRTSNFRRVLEVGASEVGANSALWSGDFATNWNKFSELE